MIYISIDNDYHYELALTLIDQHKLQSSNLRFISHNSIRNQNIKYSNYHKIEIDGHPLSDGFTFKSIESYVSSIKHAKKLFNKIQFNSNDILIIFTEYQINNALYAEKMKSVGGCVYLFDEGIGFYFNNSPYHGLAISLKDKFFLVLYQIAFSILKIPVVVNKGQEGRMFLSIRDPLIDKLYSRLKLPLSRKVRVEPQPVTYRAKKEDSGTAFFIASNFECFNLKKEEMDLSLEVITHMTKVFSKVYLKIHPSDYLAKNDVSDFYNRLKYSNLIILDNSLSAIEVMKLYNPDVAVSSMSTVLFDCLYLGVEPIFLFNLLPKNDAFSVFNFTLNNLKYNFVNHISHISPLYKSGIDFSDLYSSTSENSELGTNFKK